MGTEELVRERTFKCSKVITSMKGAEVEYITVDKSEEIVLTLVIYQLEVLDIGKQECCSGVQGGCVGEHLYDWMSLKNIKNRDFQ